MQKALDNTEESLAQGFASLAKNAKRQRFLYLATILTLMAIVVTSAILLATVAINRQLSYRRAFAIEYASDFSLLVHREVSFLRRTELTMRYYQETDDTRPVAQAVADTIGQSGVATGHGEGPVNEPFDLLVGDTTRDAWKSGLNVQLWRLYEAAQSTLATQEAFELHHRAMMIGLADDYMVIVPSLAAAGGRGAVPLQPALIRSLRETLLRQLLADTGKRLPARGEQLWLGPYVDPLQGIPVMTAVSAYYKGDAPEALLTMSISLATLTSLLERPDPTGSLLLLTPGKRVIAASPALTPSISQQLAALPADMEPGTFRYTRHGVLLLGPTVNGFGAVFGVLPWHALIAAARGELIAIACVTLIILASIVAIARLWGLRLLSRAFAETTRALESETLSHVLVSATPVGLCIVRQRDYSILTANALAGTLLKLDRNRGRLAPHIEAALKATATRAGGNAALARIAEVILPADTGEAEASDAQFLQITYAPVRYSGEDVLFCAILDVTTRHALEQRLRVALQATKAVMRMRSNFFASMSHEIRTPLNALLGNLELLCRAPELEAHHQRLRGIDVTAQALRGIVNDILDFSKIDAGEMQLVQEPFRLIDDFENMALSYVPLSAGSPVRFYSHLMPGLDRVLNGDRGRIAQVVSNLLSNAFKFTSRGKIVFHADVTKDVQGRNILTCRVCDSGIGMSPALVARIFDPFVQGESGTSNRYGGTGLGLSICAKLCELMGGHISVESVLGVGSAFSVSIPLGAPTEEGVAQPVPPQRGTVLAVCLERETGELLDAWLARAGWFVEVVHSKTAAELWLRVNRPDALLVTGEFDLNAVAALRDVHPVSVVWITSSGPLRPVSCARGVLEVSEFGHAGVLSAVDLAAGGLADEARAEIAGTLPASAARPATVHDQELKGLVVLVVEDNPLNLALVVEQLEVLGCEPFVVGDGRQALAALEHVEVDVVLSDLHMPVMSGYELVAQLHRSHPALPVLAFSAVTDSRQTAAWRAHGFSGYVAKPASLDDLAAALGALADELEFEGAYKEAIASPPDDLPAPRPHRVEPDRERYTALLKEHLSADMQRLVAITSRQDRRALGDWAHSAAGAFLVVCEPGFASRCRALQRMCQHSSEWSAEIAGLATALHDDLRTYFGFEQRAVS